MASDREYNKKGYAAVFIPTARRKRGAHDDLILAHLRIEQESPPYQREAAMCSKERLVEG